MRRTPYELKRALAVRVSKAEYTEPKSPFTEHILVAALGGVTCNNGGL